MAAATTGPSPITKTWTATEWWEKFKQPTSDWERDTLANLKETNDKLGGILAIPAAIPGIFASAVYVVVNPVNGILTGVGKWYNGHWKDGANTIALGFVGTTRSLYNICRIFFVAVLGIIPPLNSTMYDTILDYKESEAKQIQALKGEIVQLQNRIDDLNKVLNDGAKFVSDAAKPYSDEVNATLENVNTVLSSLISPLQVTGKSKKEIESLTQQLADARDHIKKLEQNIEKFSAQNLLKDEELSTQNQHIEDLKKEHEDQLSTQKAENQKALEDQKEQFDHKLEKTKTELLEQQTQAQESRATIAEILQAITIEADSLETADPETFKTVEAQKVLTALKLLSAQNKKATDSKTTESEIKPVDSEKAEAEIT